MYNPAGIVGVFIVLRAHGTRLVGRLPRDVFEPHIFGDVVKLEGRISYVGAAVWLGIIFKILWCVKLEENSVCKNKAEIVPELLGVSDR